MNTAEGIADPRRWLVLAVTACGLLLICVDLTVLYVALPALTRDLAATNSERLWILNAYPIVVAGLLPGCGTLGDRFGHRRLFLAGLITFGSASIAAALSPSPEALIGARALLGVGAALMMPATLAIIRSTFTDDRERSVAIGWWAGIASGGMALGPLVAGLLLERFSWGAVFLINVPVVALALVATLWLVPRRAAPGGPPWDLAGSVQLLVALTALMMAIKEPARQDFAAWRMAAALLVAGVTLTLYLRGQRHREQPLLDLTLFRAPAFAGAFAAACLGTAGAVGVELVLSQYLQLVEQRSPLSAALVLLPSALAGLVAGPLAGRLLHRGSAMRVGRGAFVLAAASTAALALLPPAIARFEELRLLLLAGMGFGIGATVTFASSTIMNAAPRDRGGMAASIEEVGFEFGNALGVAVFGSVMTLAYSSALLLPESAAPWPGVVRDSLDEALRVADGLADSEAVALRQSARAAFGAALQATLLGVAALWLVTAACIRGSAVPR